MKFLSSLTAAVTIGISFIAATPASADTIYLVIGIYQQGRGGKPILDKDSSPSMSVIPMQTIEQCELAGESIQEDIFKGVKNLDGRWTCVEGK